jgi:hypothetical protein
MPSPLVLGPLGEDMVGRSSDRKIETGEEAEYAIDPERPLYLKRSDAGGGRAA